MATFGIMILLAIWPVANLAETFVSMADMMTLALSYSKVFDTMENMVDQNEEREMLTAKLKVSSSRWTKLERHAAKEWTNKRYGYVLHPVAALNLINRWRSMLAQTKGDFVKKMPEFIRLMPDEGDYRGAIRGLVRLQETYKLDTAQLAAGIVANISAGHPMNVADCLAMGKAWMAKDRDMAIGWFQLVQSHTGVTEDMRATIETELSDNKRESKQEEDQRPAVREVMDKYRMLCRGENITNTIAHDRKLACIYRRGVLPYIRYKEEIHSFDPRISLLHDVISDENIEALKTKSYSLLEPAKIGHDTFSSKKRTSKIAWLDDHDATIEKISRQVSHITGLSTQYRPGGHSDAEKFQIVSYGIAGQYEPHVDYLGDSLHTVSIPTHLENSGDRLATFMYYMSDTEAGGATVFPNIGVRISPIKNAAAFWYNYRLSGQRGDGDTVHSGCPVLLGQKWVANKWIRMEGQIFRRPCALSKDAPDPLFYS